MKGIFVLPRIFALKIIEIYQKTLSFDHGFLKYMFPNGYCRYKPTCSQYAYQAIAKYGLIRGGIMGAWRVMRCNPWSKGGEDPIK